MNRRITYAVLIALLLTAAPAVMAQDTSGMNHGDEPMMHHDTQATMHHDTQPAMMGEHDMPGTVTQVNHKTGIVELTSLGMTLRVHFPPPSIAALKPGDHIQLHLGYRMSE